MERTLSDISLSSTSPPASLFDSSPMQSTVALQKTTSTGTPPFSSVFAFINESKQQNKQVQEQQSHSESVSTSLIDDLLFNTKLESSTSSSSQSSSSNDTQDPSPSLLSSSFKNQYQQQQQQNASPSKLKNSLLLSSLQSSSSSSHITTKKISTSSPLLPSSVNTMNKRTTSSNHLLSSSPSSSSTFINKKSRPLLTTAVNSSSILLSPSSSSPSSYSSLNLQSSFSKFNSPSPMSYSSLLQDRQKKHYHYHNKTPEMNGLIEETAWKKIQMEKQLHKDKIYQVYKEKWNILNDIQQVKKSIDDNENEKKIILESNHRIEDSAYIKVEKLDHEIKEMDQRLVTLMKKLLHELTNHPLKVTWHDLLYYIKKEETCANNVVLSYQLNKKERALQLHKYHSDIDKNHQQQLSIINKKKEDINLMKKENDDELGSWERSNTELNEKIIDIIKEETVQKEELCNKVNALDEEIEALLLQLEGLRQKKQAHLGEMQQLDYKIEQKTATFYPQQVKLTKSKKEIDSRKNSIDQQLMSVDQQYKQLEENKNHQQENYDYQTKELNEIDLTIEQATEQCQLNQLEEEFISTILNEIVIDRDHLISQKLQSQLQMKTEIKDNEYHLLQQQQTCDQSHQQLNDHLFLIEQLSSKKNGLLRKKEWSIQMLKRNHDHSLLLSSNNNNNNNNKNNNNPLVSKLEKEIENLQQLINQEKEKQNNYQMDLDHQLNQLEEINKTISRLNRQQKHEQLQITETMKDVLKLIEDKLSQYTNKKEAKLLIDNEMKNIQIWKQYFDIENQDNING